MRFMPVDLTTSPRWQAEHLGLPLPDDRDAVSACLPRWQDNIAYEEGDEHVVGRLQAAYPRFCIHPDVRRLCERLFADGAGLPFASEAAAERAVEYVRHAGGTSAVIQEIAGQPCAGVSVSPEEMPLLRQYWQHAGEIVSSRMARDILDGRQVTFSETEARREIRRRVADRHGVPSDCVCLWASGMAAVAAVWRAVRRRSPGQPTCQFGFPYVDSLKIQQRFPGAQAVFLPAGNDRDLEVLRDRFAARSVSAVFCESPANPLLTTPDLDSLHRLCDEHDAVFIVDDTLRACSRRSVLPRCDVVVTSLTKYFSGTGNVLAGAMILNPDSSRFRSLKQVVDAGFQETLSDTDADVLEQNSRDLDNRVRKCVRGAQELVARLRAHPAVADVFYPSEEEEEEDDTSRGALFSIVLRDAARVTPAFFDRLEFCKGPNLGTRFSLCCPYTILAHYHELEFAEQCGVSRWLLRFSVGTEPADLLWDRIERALDSATRATGG